MNFLRSLPTYAGFFLELNDFFGCYVPQTSSLKVSRYVYDESEFIIASLSPLREQSVVGSSPPDVKVCGAEFCNFAEVTLEEIKKFSRKPLSKSCGLDPLPAVVLKGYRITSYYYEDHQSVLIDWCCARCSEGCYTIAHIEKI